MRVIVQRVSRASCKVQNKITGSIEKGFLLFIGFKDGDSDTTLNKVLKKVINLRIFEDENDKMNKNLMDVNGSILAISQFTLYANCKHGNRPSFTEAMEYNQANKMYLNFCNLIEENGIKVEKGIFGAMMEIDLLNDGPVTIIIDSDTL